MPRPRVEQVADLLGAGVAKAIVGKDVLSDELPFVTGLIGLPSTRPSWEMMRDCDTLLTVGSSFPYAQFLPKSDEVRAVQIDVDAKMIGIRYPYELNIVGAAATTGAWSRALSADRPTVLDFYGHPNVPPIPPHATSEQAFDTATAMIKGDQDVVDVVKEGIKTNAQEFLPHRKG